MERQVLRSCCVHAVHPMPASGKYVQRRGPLRRRVAKTSTKFGLSEIVRNTCLHLVASGQKRPTRSIWPRPSAAGRHVSTAAVDCGAAIVNEIEVSQTPLQPVLYKTNTEGQAPPRRTATSQTATNKCCPAAAACTALQIKHVQGLNSEGVIQSCLQIKKQLLVRHLALAKRVIDAEATPVSRRQAPSPSRPWRLPPSR